MDSQMARGPASGDKVMIHTPGSKDRGENSKGPACPSRGLVGKPPARPLYPRALLTWASSGQRVGAAGTAFGSQSFANPMPVSQP